MERLRTLLSDPSVRGVAESQGGERAIFRRQGVVDLFTLVTNRPRFLSGGRLADRVVGRGAAWLAVKGGAAEVYAHLMSRPALQVLQNAGISASCSRLEDRIIARDGKSTCPVELATAQCATADDACREIRGFLLKAGLLK